MRNVLVFGFLSVALFATPAYPAETDLVYCTNQALPPDAQLSDWDSARPLSFPLKKYRRTALKIGLKAARVLRELSNWGVLNGNQILPRTLIELKNGEKILVREVRGRMAGEPEYLVEVYQRLYVIKPERQKLLQSAEGQGSGEGAFRGYVPSKDLEVAEGEKLALVPIPKDRPLLFSEKTDRPLIVKLPKHWHDVETYGAFFMKSGRRLFTPAKEELLVWDLESLKPILKIKPTKGAHFTSGQISPDGRLLVAGQNNGKVIVFNAESGEKIWSSSKNDGAVDSIRFTHDGEHVLAGSAYSMLLVFDAKTGEWMRTLSFGGGRHSELELSPQGDAALVMVKLRAYEYEYGETYRVDLQTWKAERLSSIALFTKRVTFSPDGQTWLVAGDDKALLMKAGGSERPKQINFRNLNAAAYSPDGSLFVLLGSDGKAVVYDAKSDRRLFVFILEHESDFFHHVTFSPDSKRLVFTPRTGGQVEVWNIPNVKFVLKQATNSP